jgi:hypothetical protein
VRFLELASRNSRPPPSASPRPMHRESPRRLKKKRSKVIISKSLVKIKKPSASLKNRGLSSFEIGGGGRNGKLREELLNREIFTTLEEAKVLIEQWRREYNQVRSHSALRYRPPAPEAILIMTYQVVSLLRTGHLKCTVGSNKEAAMYNGRTAEMAQVVIVNQLINPHYFANYSSRIVPRSGLWLHK